MEKPEVVDLIDQIERIEDALNARNDMFLAPGGASLEFERTGWKAKVFVRTASGQKYYDVS